MNSFLYLDYNATTPIDPVVRAAMLPFLENDFGNPSSLYALGRHASLALTRAREQVAAILGAQSSEIIFNSGATESITTAFLSALTANPSKRHIITSAVEHSATLELCRHYQQHGYEITFLPVDAEGNLSLQALAEAITPNTALVSLLWANNETGVIFPVEKIAAITAQHDVALHLDAVQAVGKIPINLEGLKIRPFSKFASADEVQDVSGIQNRSVYGNTRRFSDAGTTKQFAAEVEFSKGSVQYLSLSGHKIYSPKGIGALYVHRHACYTPLLRGSQEQTRRGGTENMTSIVALGEASRLAQQLLLSEITRETALRDRLEQGLLSALENVYVNGNREQRLPNTTNLTFDRIQAAEALLLLDQEGLSCSAGSACNTQSRSPSHVLSAMGRTHAQARASLRLSVGRFTTEAEIDRALEIIPRVIKKLRCL